jgi:hypothetical protein
MTQKEPKIFRGTKRMAYKEGFDDGVQAVEAKLLPVHNEVVEMLALMLTRNDGEIVVTQEELEKLRQNPRGMKSSIDPVTNNFKIHFAEDKQ